MGVTPEDIVDKLKLYKNIILYGPPGTGKTHLVKEVLALLDTGGEYNYYNISAPISISHKQKFSYEWCTFHPSYSYENFVFGLDPVISKGKLGYTHHVGPFLSLAKKNSIDGNETLLVIDEINRANTSSVFGDVVGLLERNNRDSTAINLVENIKVNGVEMKELKVNDSFYIIGTMNSLDKSVKPLDSNILTRFQKIEIRPDVKILESHLKQNINVNEEITEFVLKLFKYLNTQLNNYVGKEYELGQGYFWELVTAEDNIIETLADIIKYKIFPHLKDVFPEDLYIDLFKSDNLGELYHQIHSGYEFMNISQYSAAKIINLMAIACESKLRLEEDDEETCTYKTFLEYEEKKIEELYVKLKKYKNIILSGNSGTGKTSRIRLLKNKYSKWEEMHWHSSTSYEDVLEGISTEIKSNGDVKYSYRDGKLLNLINNGNGKDILMAIEGIDRSSASENFGELITLLEPDKRDDISISLQSCELKLPAELDLICTINPSLPTENKLDSALKRRFVIIDLYPDYELLRLWFEINRVSIDKERINSLTSREDILNLALGLLKGLNSKISYALGKDFQIGHSVFWDLKDEGDLSLNTLYRIFDETILPLISDYLHNEEIAKLILGENSPLINIKYHGVEISNFIDLTDEKKFEALKELYEND